MPIPIPPPEPPTVLIQDARDSPVCVIHAAQTFCIIIIKHEEAIYLLLDPGVLQFGSVSP